MLVVLSAALMLVDLCFSYVAIMQLGVSATLIEVKGSAANMWVTIFFEIMQVGVCYNHAGGVFYSTLCT